MLSVSTLFSQTTFDIPDTKLKNHFLSEYPSLMDGSDNLIIANAQNFTDTLKCINEGVVNISGLEYFTSTPALVFHNNDIVDLTPIENLTQITFLGFNQNEIETVPDLSSFSGLHTFAANYNQLDNPPVFPVDIQKIYLGNNSLSGTYDISAYTALIVLHLFENDIKKLPGLESATQITSLDLHTNELYLSKDLTALTQLVEVDLSDNYYGDLPLLSTGNLTTVGIGNNYLSFEDLLPFEPLTIFPSNFIDFDIQKTPDTSQSITLVEGQTFTMTLSFDETVNSNTYTWYKGTQELGTTTTGSYTIENIASSSAGIYTCEVTNGNTKLSGITITSAAVTLTVDPAPPCFTLDDVTFSIDTVKCEQSASAQLNTMTSGTTIGDLVISLVNDDDSLVSTDGSFSFTQEKTFNIVVSDDVCQQSWSTPLVILFNTTGCEESKPLSFSPNDDGVEDTYYISQTGKAKIYDKRGNLVKEINTPNTWNGTNNNNEHVPYGYYIIILNEKDKKGITVLK